MAHDYTPMPRTLGDQTESDLYKVPVEYRADLRDMVARAYAVGHLDGYIYGQQVAARDAEASIRFESEE